MANAAKKPIPSDQQAAADADALYQRACKVLPGGVSRNTIYRHPRPDYADFGRGCVVTDTGGIQRIDFSNNMASLIHGHAHPQIIAAVEDQLRRGSAFTMATEAELQFAELLCQRTPGFDKLRFVNSGTEAVMVAIKAARCLTGRPKIAKVEGAYHGTYDYAEASQCSTPDNWGPSTQPASVPVADGTPVRALDDVVVVPFNNIAATLALLDQFGDEIACVLLDPLPHRVGLIPADNDYVVALREWTARHGALLVMDEVITYRSEYAGAQAWYDVCPDLTAMGKIIGGGFPVGAIAGRDDVMQVMDPTTAGGIPLPHSGTFSANPITTTAGRVAMELFDRDAVQRLNELGEYARQQLTEAVRSSDTEACITGAGSMLRLHLLPEAPTNYRANYMDAATKHRIAQLVAALYDRGFLMINTCSAALSTAMTNDEIDHLAQAVREALSEGL